MISRRFIYLFHSELRDRAQKTTGVSQTLPQILRAEATVSGDAPAWNENLPFRCGEQQDMNGFCLYFHKMHGTGEFTYLYIYIYTSTCTNLPETPTKYYIL